MPRLLVVSTVAETLEGFFLPHADHFRSRGWIVDAAAHGAASNPGCLRAYDRAFDVPWSRDPRDVLRQLRGTVGIRRVLRAGSFVIVHVHTPVASLLTRLAVATLGRRIRPKVVYTAHGFHFHAQGSVAGNFLYRALERLAGIWTDRLVVTNEEDRRTARSRSIARPGSMRFIPGVGVDLDVYRPTEDTGLRARVRDQLGIPPDAPVLLVVAELNREKRHRDVISALALMDHRTAHLVLAGAGPLEADLRLLGRQLSLTQRMHLLGYRADVPSLMNAADVLVLPSSREGLSRSVIEAQAVGLPVLGADVRGIRDLLDQDRGVLYPVGDVDQLAGALDRLIRDPDQARRRAASARAAIGRYELGTIIRAHEELYEDLLRAPGA
jgi:glycosyltransferase involved in cell wall biosynthesis